MIGPTSSLAHLAKLPNGFKMNSWEIRDMSMNVRQSYVGFVGYSFAYLYLQFYFLLTCSTFLLKLLKCLIPLLELQYQLPSENLKCGNGKSSMIFPARNLHVIIEFGDFPADPTFLLIPWPSSAYSKRPHPPHRTPSAATGSGIPSPCSMHAPGQWPVGGFSLWWITIGIEWEYILEIPG